MAEVIIYTRQACGYCTSAKRLLDRKGISYVERDATGNPQLRQEMIQRANGRATFPQIFIDSHHVGGCDDLHDLDGQGRLDLLLAS